MDSITKRDLVRALEQLLPPLDPDSVKFGTIVDGLARRLGVEKDELKAKYKGELKTLIVDMIHLCKGGEDKENDPENAEEEDEDVMPRKKKSAKRSRIQESEDDEEESDEEDEKDEDDEDDDEASGDDSEEERQPKRRKKASPTAKKQKSAPAKRKTPAPKAADKRKDSEGMTALKELARVAGLLSPAVYAQLKKLDTEEEQEEVLRERLQDAGVRFSAPYPKKSDIAAAKRKRDKEKELDGIDTSLIITGGRSRRSAPQVSYAASYDEDEEEEHEGEQHNDSEEELHDRNEEESEAHEDASEASDDSEAEF